MQGTNDRRATDITSEAATNRKKIKTKTKTEKIKNNKHNTTKADATAAGDLIDLGLLVRLFRGLINGF